MYQGHDFFIIVILLHMTTTQFKQFALVVNYSKQIYLTSKLKK